MVTTIVEPAVARTATVTTSTTSSYSPTSNTTGKWSYTSVTKTRTKRLNPDRFDHLKANGFVPPLAYNASQSDATLSCGTVKLTWPDGNKGFNTLTNVDTMYCDPVSQVAFNHAAAAKAVAAATAAANSALRSQSMSLIEDIAEGRQTYNLVVGSVLNVTRSIKQMKQGRFKQALTSIGASTDDLKSGKTAAQAWLAWRYGIRPLMFEIEGAMHLLTKKLAVTNVVRHVSGTGSADVSLKSNGNRVARTGNHAFYGTVYYKSETSATFKSKVGYVYTLKNAAVAAGTSVGLTNLPLVAWELVTLSFVIDWFINVSEVLEQLDAWSASSWLAGYTTTKLTETTTYRSTRYTPPAWPNVIYSHQPAVGIYSRQTIERIVHQKPPTIGLVVRPKLNWQRLTDAVALLRMFKK